jgi:hypothetical protein
LASTARPINKSFADRFSRYLPTALPISLQEHEVFHWQEMIMPDDTSQRGGQDRKRINMGQEHEVRY